MTGLALAALAAGVFYYLWRRVRRAEAALQGLLTEQETNWRRRLRAFTVEQQRLQRVLDHLAEGVILLDAERRVVLINPAAAATFGVVADQVRGRELFAVTGTLAVEQTLARALATGEPAQCEFGRAIAGDQTRTLECLVVPLARADDGGALLVVRDITRFRQLERMRSEFVAAVTHELRTPLTAILGFAETLESETDPDARGHFLGIIRSEALRLHALINDLLDLSGIESGRIRLRRERVDLSAVVAAVAQRLGPRARAAGIRVQADLPPDLPPVLGDRDWLDQVFANLLDNAIKYSPGGGNVSITGRRDGDAVVLSVADQGIGIPVEHQQRVFERFYRVDKGRSRAAGGTGLGLSIVKHIAEGHGGRVWVESAPGRGAVFHVRLPIAGGPAGLLQTLT